MPLSVNNSPSPQPPNLLFSYSSLELFWHSYTHLLVYRVIKKEVSTFKIYYSQNCYIWTWSLHIQETHVCTSQPWENVGVPCSCCFCYRWWYSSKSLAWTIELMCHGTSGAHTGMLHFLALFFIGLHNYYDFINIEAAPFTSKRVMTWYRLRW